MDKKSRYEKIKSSRKVLRALIVVLAVSAFVFVNLSNGVYFSPGEVYVNSLGSFLLAAFIIGLIVILIFIVFFLHFLNNYD